MKNKLKKIYPRKKAPLVDKDTRVTNDTVALHREEVLKGARKYIYPLQHAKHKLVGISISVFLVALLGFFSYCVVVLYKTKNYSDFIYKVTKVVPFPVARIGSDFVPYENYLFEINHYKHYYQTQQKLDFNTDAGKAQLAEFKKRALDKVVDDAYVKEIAKQNNITVSESEVDDAIKVVRDQNRLSGNDQELSNILNEYWGWNIKDFRRSLKTQTLNHKVVSFLAKDTHDKANTAYQQLKNGKDFAQLAKEVSEDNITAQNGGEYGALLDKSSRDLSPKIADAIFKLKPNEYSGVIDTGYGLEIVKVLEVKGNQVRAAHIAFNYKDTPQYLNDIKAKQKSRKYISF